MHIFDPLEKDIVILQRKNGKREPAFYYFICRRGGRRSGDYSIGSIRTGAMSQTHQIMQRLWGSVNRVKQVDRS